MDDVILGAVAVVVGALLCFRGYLALRIVIALWGAFVGFVVGAGLVSPFSGAGFLASPVAWVVGLVVALVFGFLAYLYYVVSVVLAMSAIGFVLGTSVVIALGVTWSWVVVVVGVAVGVAFGAVAVLSDLPMVLLAVLSSLAGASLVIGGLMLLVGTLGTDDLTARAATARLDDGWWWYAGYVALAVVGIVVQVRSRVVGAGSVRDTWYDSGSGRPPGARSR